MNSIVKSIEEFPTAFVPGAGKLSDVFAEWKRRGLVPQEVTAEELRQTITIEHDTLNGKITYRRDGADALQTIALLWDAIRLIARHELFSNVRPKLNSGNAAIAISLDGNKITAIHDPPHDPVVLSGLLLADLCNLCDMVDGENFDASESLSRLIQFERKE